MVRVKVCIETKYLTVDFAKRHLKHSLFNTVNLFKYLEVTYFTEDNKYFFTVADALGKPSFNFYGTNSLEAFENVLNTYIMLGILDTESLRAPPFRPLNLPGVEPC